MAWMRFLPQSYGEDWIYSRNKIQRYNSERDRFIEGVYSSSLSKCDSENNEGDIFSLVA